MNIKLIPFIYHFIRTTTTMRTLLLALLTLLTIGLFSTAALCSDFHKEVKVSPGKLLQMDLASGGDITIQGWDKDLVSVDVYYHGGDDNRCKIDVDEKSGGVEISSRYDGRNRNYNTSLRFEVN